MRWRKLGSADWAVSHSMTNLIVHEKHSLSAMTACMATAALEEMALHLHMAWQTDERQEASIRFCAA